MPRLKAIVAFLVWISLVTIGSLMPIDGPDIESFINYDKVVHVIFYLVMTYLLLKSISRNGSYIILIAIVICSGYGILMEVLQGALDLGRYFDYYDIIANIIGSLIGALIYRFTI